MPRVDAMCQVQITEQTFYRWRKQYGGIGTDQLKELKRLQKENDRRRRAVSDLTLDKFILLEAAQGKRLIKNSVRASGLHQEDIDAFSGYTPELEQHKICFRMAAFVSG